MEGRLKAKVLAMTMELAREEQARLRAAGTMVELEELACEIGDEFTSQLMSLEMANRSNQAADSTTSECPDCGNGCGQGNPNSRALAGLRGEIHYQEPTFYCPACRRSFFPGSRQRGSLRPGNGNPQVAAEDDLGRVQPRQL